MFASIAANHRAKTEDGHSILTRFAKAVEGSTIAIWALAAPVLLGITGLVLEHAMALRQESAMQAAADASALAGAKELSLSDSRHDNLQAAVDAMVQKYVSTSKSLAAVSPKVTTRIIEKPLQVQVDIQAAAPQYFGAAYSLGKPVLNVVATASVTGQPNICVLALEPKEPGALSLEGRSQLTGNNCAVFSNSTSPGGLTVRGQAAMKASTVCSSGGLSGNGNISPTPYLDCPQFEDPLASRMEPDVGRCDHTAKIVALGTVELKPGVYCLGLTISGIARVKFQPGIYIIKDGPFTVTTKAQISGEGVGIFLSGASFFVFDPLTKISLSAPTTGPMAGLLFFGSRKQSPLLQNIILSGGAQTLTGTVYLPKTSLIIDDLAQVGGKSAYTAIVARRVLLLLGPNVVLNTNYDETDVPVPEGIKSVGQPIKLTR
ncbi:MAG: pilus assembly protein TadG-related protein [Hyphomicrobium sp.]